MLCGSCGAMSGNAGFCTGCGKTLEIAAPAPRPDPKVIVEQAPAVAETIPPPTSQPAAAVRAEQQIPVARRDPRSRNRLLPVVALSLLGMVFVGGSAFAVWWLFVAPAPTIIQSDSQADSGNYGSDPELDQLWDDCAEGELDACDALYLSAATGTEYEKFGASCGDRGDGFGSCAVLGGASSTAEDGSFGSDPALDLLWVECESGSMVACDDLYLGSPIGSEYEEFGAACGGRGAADGECVARFR